MILANRVIRSCNNNDCRAIYLDDNNSLHSVKLCKYCDSPSGFFETFRHFFRNVDLYGIDTDDIRNRELKQYIEEKYNV